EPARELVIAFSSWLDPEVTLIEREFLCHAFEGADRCARKGVLAVVDVLLSEPCRPSEPGLLHPERTTPLRERGGGLSWERDDGRAILHDVAQRVETEGVQRLCSIQD